MRRAAVRSADRSGCPRTRRPHHRRMRCWRRPRSSNGNRGILASYPAWAAHRRDLRPRYRRSSRTGRSSRSRRCAREPAASGSRFRPASRTFYRRQRPSSSRRRRRVALARVVSGRLRCQRSRPRRCRGMSHPPEEDSVRGRATSRNRHSRSRRLQRRRTARSDGRSSRRPELVNATRHASRSGS
jgi:hypothetical protein